MRTDREFFLTRLYPMQDRALARLGSVDTGFYLTGGTAASRAYLRHRFSDDLDLFVNDNDRLANELTAVVDREEPKDLADIWGFCCRMELSCEAALEGAQSKAAGLFPADVARVLMSATPDDWRLVRWSDPPDCQRFIDELGALGQRLLLLDQARD